MTRLLLILLFLIPFPANGEARPPDPPAYDLALDLDPRSGRVVVSGSISLSRDGIYRFRLNPALVVTAFSLDGQSRPPKRQGPFWTVSAEKPAMMRFRYEGNISRKGTEPAPMMNGDWGAVLNEGGDWYPRLPGTFSRFAVTVKTPPPFLGVTLGTLVARTQGEGGTNRLRFEVPAPAPGLSLFVGPWIMAENKTNGVSIHTWFTKDTAALSPRYLEASARHLARYAAAIGPYPYGAFHVVAAPFPVGLGYPGLTYIGERVLALPFIPELSLRHEVLHTWWGNAVEVDYSHGNWAEGLTTFQADYAVGEETGRDREARFGWLRDFAALPPERDRPAVSFTNKDHDADQVIGYNKIAFFFHMLRREIGANRFDRAIRQFWNDRKFQGASWHDLRRAFETETGKDLGGFFRHWLSGTAAPRFGLDDVRGKKTADAFETTFTLSAVGGGDVAALSVPVAITTDDGPRRFVVRLEKKKQVFRLKTNARARNLVIDPDFDIWQRLDPATMPPIFRDVTLDKKARLIVATTGEAYRQEALSLAQRWFDGPVLEQDARAARAKKSPLMIIGNRANVRAYLSRMHPDMGVPETLTPGVVQAWVERVNGRALAVVMTKDLSALRMAARRLPHYGRKGAAVLNAGKPAVTRGDVPDGSLQTMIE